MNKKSKSKTVRVSCRLIYPALHLKSQMSLQGCLLNLTNGTFMILELRSQKIKLTDLCTYVTRLRVIDNLR